MNAGIYLRVSTLDQSTEMQRADLVDYATRRGFNIEIYEDHATGTTADRPELSRLLHDCRTRKIDIVLVWKLDRFFRSLKDLVNTLTLLTEVGVSFISLKDNIDLTTSSGRLLMHMLGAFAEFEASLIRERVKAGLRRAIANGRPVGRPRVTSDDSVLNLRREGQSIRKIAAHLGISRGAVERVIRLTRKA